MNIPNDGLNRRGSSLDSSLQSIGSGSNLNGPTNAVTVYFRLVSYSPDQMSQEDMMSGSSPPQSTIITPLNTPFTQSPVQSPVGHALGPGATERMLYPMPSGSNPIQSTTSMGNGVYYTTAGNPPPPVRRQSFYPSGHSFGHDVESEEIGIKQRAMSAEIHHTPPFGYVGGAHRASFCVPPLREKARAESLAYVSEEMLLSAMPDRYDD